MAERAIASNTLTLVKTSAGIILQAAASAAPFIPYIGPAFAIIKCVVDLGLVIKNRNEPDKYDIVLKKIEEMKNDISSSIKEETMILTVESDYKSVCHLLEEYESGEEISVEQLRSSLADLQDLYLLLDRRSIVIEYICNQVASDADATWGLKNALQIFMKLLAPQIKAIEVLQELKPESSIEKYIKGIEIQSNKFWQEFKKTATKDIGTMKLYRKFARENSVCYGAIGRRDNHSCFCRFVATKDDPQKCVLQMIDLVNGERRTGLGNSYEMQNHKQHCKMTFHEGKLYTVEYTPGSQRLCSINLETYEKITIECEGAPFDYDSQMVCYKDKLYALSKFGVLYGIDLPISESTKSNSVRYSEGWPTPTALIVINDKLYAVSKKNIYDITNAQPTDKRMPSELNHGHQFTPKGATGHGTYLYTVDRYDIYAYDPSQSQKNYKIVLRTDLKQKLTTMKTKFIQLMSDELTLYLLINYGIGDHVELHLVRPYLSECSSAQSTVRDSTELPSMPSRHIPQTVKDLKEHRKLRFENLSTEDDLLAISHCKTFIHQSIVVSGSTDADQSKTPHGVLDEILIPDGDDIKNRFILVEGNSGYGKTRLCQDLQKEGVKGYDLIQHLRLHDGSIYEASKPEDIFKEHKDRVHALKEAFKNNGERLLIMLDGFNEIPPKYMKDENGFIMQLIKGTTQLPKATRLVTSTPLNRLVMNKYFPQHYRRVELLGFTDFGKKKYIEEAFLAYKEAHEDFIKFASSNPVIDDFMTCPLRCLIVTEIFILYGGDSAKLLKTMTSLHEKMIEFLIKRHMIKRDRSKPVKKWTAETEFEPCHLISLPKDIKDNPQHSSDLDLEYICTTLQDVSVLAYKTLHDGEKYFKASDYDLKQDFEHLGLLIKNVTKTAETSYTFLHQSIQEFLAAWHISYNCDLITNAVNLCWESIDKGPLYCKEPTFIKFLAGLIGFKKELFPESIDSSSSIIQCHCLYEAKDKGISDPFQLDSTDLTLSSPFDMFVFGYILVLDSIEWTLQVGTPFDALLSSLKDLVPPAEIKGSIKELRLIKAANFETLLKLGRQQLNKICSLHIVVYDPSIPKVVPALVNLREVILTTTEALPEEEQILLSKAIVQLKGCKHFFLKTTYSDLAKIILSSNGVEIF